MTQPVPFIEDQNAEFRETESDRRNRLTWEAEGIAEALAEFDAGLYVDADEIDAWIDSMDTDHELPPPTRDR